MKNTEKKVAMIVYSNYPDDPRVRREAEALELQGVLVDVICLKKPAENKYDVINTINVFRLSVSQSRTSKVRYLLEYITFFILASFKLNILFIRNNYDYIHIHNMPDFLVFTAVLPKIFRKKIFLDLHDPMPELYMAKFKLDNNSKIIKILKTIEEISISFADKVITPNISFKNLFASRSCQEDKIEIVMNSPQIDIFKEKFDSQKILALNQKESVNIMYHGMLSERNGLLTAIDAIRLLDKYKSDIRFNIYGDGDPEFIKDFLGRIESYELDEQIKFFGFKPLIEIAEIIETADIGIIPNNRNPFTELNMPTRIFEYLCKGVPTIAPRTQGICDYYSDDNLFLFEPGNASDIALQIEKIIINPTATVELTKRSIEIYQRNNWELQAEYLVNQIYGLHN